MDARLPGNRLGLSPRARFRCLPCRRFTQATEAGACPSCGWAPPTPVVAASRPDPRVWQRVVRASAPPPLTLRRLGFALLVAGGVAGAIALALV